MIGIEGVDDLYALAPEAFVAARAALVKELKAAGRKDDAAIVAGLRRPSVTAWALNQVARAEPATVEAALEAGRALRAASDAAVAGQPDQLRAATSAERAAANAVVKATAPFLGARAGALQTTLLATLRAAALDDRVADELRRGVLTTDHDQPGFGFGFDSDDGPPAPRPATTRKSAAPKGQAKKTTLRAVPDLPPEPEVDPEVARAAAEQAKAERAARQAAQRAYRKEHAAPDPHARPAPQGGAPARQGGRRGRGSGCRGAHHR